MGTPREGQSRWPPSHSSARAQQPSSPGMGITREKVTGEDERTLRVRGLDTDHTPRGEPGNAQRVAPL